MLKSSFANFTLYPLFWLAVCFVSGILMANFVSLDWKILLTICIFFQLLAIIFIRKHFALIFVLVAFTAAGNLFFQVEKQPLAENRVKRIYEEKRVTSGDPIEIEGVLSNEPELAVEGLFLTLNTEKAVYKSAEMKISGKVRLFAPMPTAQIKNEYEQLNLQYGARVRVACNLRREDKFINAGVLSQTKLLDQQDIDATGIIKSSLLVEKISDAEFFTPLAWIYERRQNLIIYFRDNFNHSAAGVLTASLLGNQYFLDKETAEVFRTGGTFHVLVISGLHITFIGGLTLLFIQFFTNKKLWQFLIATLLLWSYSLAVGANVPVIRATIMFTILLFSQVIYRSGTLLNAFGLCALILLVWRPADIFTSSFQLTFASVGAIILMAFPLIEKLRSIGNWSPSVEMPFPPKTSVWLKRFCEMIHWREKVWENRLANQLWSVNLFKSPYLRWLESRNLQTAVRYLFEAVIVSLIVQAWLLPFLIVYFHRLSVFSIFLNIWVGIIIALESFAAVFAVLSATISDTLALPFIKLTEILNWLLVSVPGFLTENNWANIRIPNYSGAMRNLYVLYFLPVIFLTFALNNWKPFAVSFKSESSKFNLFAPKILRFAALSFFLFFTLIVFHPFSSPIADGKLHIDFLDVGQGDSALIRFPTGELMLIDGGGNRNFNKFSNNDATDDSDNFEPDTQTVGERVVSNFLWERGYSQIDYIMATHADADHIQGLADVAKNFRVRAAIFGRTPLKNAEFTKLQAILQKRGIESLVVSRGDVLNFENVKVEVLNPEKDENKDADWDNNNSIVLRVVLGTKKILLTGDIEKETEAELLNMPEYLESDIIKVAHHGSRTSSTQAFINLSKANLAIISVGKNSPFEHPHEEVVKRWKKSGAKVLTTGENGTISISTEGHSLFLENFTNQEIAR